MNTLKKEASMFAMLLNIVILVLILWGIFSMMKNGKL